ncbi:hypothetical protein ACTXT7_012088 [Hymenolepis weldensis]
MLFRVTHGRVCERAGASMCARSDVAKSSAAALAVARTLSRLRAHFNACTVRDAPPSVDACVSPRSQEKQLNSESFIKRYNRRRHTSDSIPEMRPK